MGTYNPPSYYFTSIGFNPVFYQTSSSGFTQAQANKLYLRKTTNDTATAVENFSAGVILSSIVSDRNDDTATDLSSWILKDVLYQDMTHVGNSYQLFGYTLTPTLNAIDFYPQANTPIGIFQGFYNIQATFQLTGTAINSTGRLAFGVTSNSATGDWLYASNGNFNNNIVKTHVGTMSGADLPLVFTVNFTAYYAGYLYFKYYIQAGSITGSLLVNYYITRLG
jgi:hypothetical protein